MRKTKLTLHKVDFRRRSATIRFSLSRLRLTRHDNHQSMQAENTASKASAPAVQLTQYQDADLTALRLELVALENQLAELLAEQGEAHAALHAYNVAFHEELGELLLQVMEARMRAAEAAAAEEKLNEKIRQAQREYEQFNQQQSEVADAEPIIELPDTQKDELKSLYKKSVQKCHPDRLPESQKAIGTKMTQELQAALQQQDLTRMRELAKQIQNSAWNSIAGNITDAQILQQQTAALRKRIVAVQAELQEFYADATWKVLHRLAAQEISWPDYFAEVRAALEKELTELNETAAEVGA